MSGKDGEGLEKKQKHFTQAELPEKIQAKKEEIEEEKLFPF